MGMALLLSLWLVQHTFAGHLDVFVHAPVNFKTKKLDLDNLESINGAPLFSKNLLIPYATEEPKIVQEIEKLIGGHKEIVIKCWTDWGPFGKSDWTCPDIRIKIDIHSFFKFTKKGQPTLSRVGPAADNKWHVAVEAEADLGAHISIYARTGDGAINWGSTDFDVDVDVKVNAKGSANVKMASDFTITFDSTKIELRKVGGNVDVTGLQGDLMELGAGYGFAIAGPVGALIGVFLGDKGADAAKAEITKLVNAQVKIAITQGNTKLNAMMLPLLQQAVKQIPDVANTLLNTKPIPGQPYSVKQLLDAAGGKLVVSSASKKGTASTGDDLKAAVISRFSPVAGGMKMSGEIRFPKKQCQYIKGGNAQIGYFQTPVAIIPSNADLKPGQACSTILASDDLATQAYLGEDANRYLTGTTDPTKSWKSIGTFGGTGSLTNSSKWFACHFEIGSLPTVSILDVAPRTYELGNRLGLEHVYRFRVMLGSMAGYTFMLKSDGSLGNKDNIVIGGAGPETLSDCPSFHTSGQGWAENPISQLKHRGDCPMCGGIAIFQGGDVILPPLAKFNALQRTNAAATTKFLAAPARKAAVLSARAFATPLTLPQRTFVKGVGSPPIELQKNPGAELAQPDVSLSAKPGATNIVDHAVGGGNVAKPGATHVMGGGNVANVNIGANIGAVKQVGAVQGG